MLEHLFGQEEWKIVPAGGATGKAFVAQHDEQKLFLKRNSSPFLAVLSAEGIVPKLVWTRRLENGDVITAQHWLVGRVLKPAEMNHEGVAELLKTIHRSEPLLGLLRKIGKKPIEPADMLGKLIREVDADLGSLPIVQTSLAYLKEKLSMIQSDEKVVCHCDVNHNNWLLSEDNQLYLIDWDGAMIGDPAIDLGMLLYSYIPQQNWEEWFRLYELDLTEHLQLRMEWYFISQTLSLIQWNKRRGRTEEVDELLQKLMDHF